MNVIRKIIFLTTLCGVVSGLCAQNISISTTKTSLVLSAPVGEELKYIYIMAVNCRRRISGQSTVLRKVIYPLIRSMA